MRKHLRRRLRAMLVLCCIIVSLVSFDGVSASASETLFDEYNEAIVLMRELGVLNAEMEYDPAGSVCRQELAVYLAKLLGVEESEVDCRYFVDVPAGSYGTWAINHLTERGIFSTNEEHLFNPKANTNMDEVCKVLTTVLGYGRYAEAKGGYPIGYRMAAKAAELDFGDVNDITFEALMVMFYRAVCSELYEPIYFGTDSVVMEKSDETLLSVYHNMYEAEGTVNAVGGMSVYASEQLDANQIMIDKEKYLLETEIYEPDFLAKYVKYFYADRNSGQGVVKAIFSDSVKAETVIDIKDVEAIAAKEVTYRDGSDKRKTFELSGMTWIYNGSPLESEIANTLAGLNKGSVVLCDSDADNVYDTVLVWNYTNFVVSGANAQTKVIYNKLNAGGSIDSMEYDSVLVYDGKYNELSWDDISVNGVLSVAASRDKRVINIIASNTEFNGTLLHTYDNPVRIGVNGESYEIEPSYVDEYNAEGVVTGNVYHYKTDAFGYVAYIYSDISDNPMKFAYVVEGTTVDNPFSKNIILRVLKQDGVAEELILADTVKIDGVKYEDASKIIAAFPVKSDSGELISPQMIRYELNEAGEIKNIDTTSLNPQYETTDNSLTVIGDESYTVKWYRRNRVGLDAYIDNTQTYIFAVPEKSLSGGFDPEEYRVGNVGTLLSEDRQIAANVYTVSGRSEFAEAMIYEYKYARLNRNFSPTVVEVIMVDEIGEALDGEGNTVKCIKGMRGGSEVSVNIPNNVNIGEIGRGDLIQLRYGINDQIIPTYVDGEADIITLYDYSAYEGGIPTGWSGAKGGMTLYEQVSDAGYNYYRKERQLSYGFVSDKTENYIWWGYTAPGNYDEMFKVSDIPIMVYDKDAREGMHMYKGTINDIDDAKMVGGNECSSIILHTGLGTGRALFVYK